MASDEEYAAFLDKVNQDPSAGVSTTAQSHTPETATLTTKSADLGQDIPTVINDVESFYVSETDEAFESVALDWDGAGQGKWPSEGMFFSEPAISIVYVLSHLRVCLINDYSGIRTTD